MNAKELISPTGRQTVAVTTEDRPQHEFDDDACCIHCGFDGAEWHHWKHHTYEGRADPEARPPLCIWRGRAPI